MQEQRTFRTGKIKAICERKKCCVLKRQKETKSCKLWPVISTFRTISHREPNRDVISLKMLHGFGTPIWWHPVLFL